MQRLASLAVAIVVVSSQAVTFSQSRTPASATHISKADIEAVLKHVGPEGGSTDRQIKVVDMGKYNVGVGVIHRGPTKPGAPVGGIGHSQVTEVYYVLSGSGTFISGGTVLNRKEQAADSEIVRLAVGPSFSGSFQGGNPSGVGGRRDHHPARRHARVHRGQRRSDVSHGSPRRRPRAPFRVRPSSAEEVTGSPRGDFRNKFLELLRPQYFRLVFSVLLPLVSRAFCTRTTPDPSSLRPTR